MSHFICPECGAHIIDSPKGYLSGCRHYPIEPRNSGKSDNDYCNSKLHDLCSGCKWDSTEDACKHPLFNEMVEAGVIVDCFEPASAPDTSSTPDPQLRS